MGSGTEVDMVWVYIQTFLEAIISKGVKERRDIP